MKRPQRARTTTSSGDPGDHLTGFTHGTFCRGQHCWHRLRVSGQLRADCVNQRVNTYLYQIVEDLVEHQPTIAEPQVLDHRKHNIVGDFTSAWL